MSSCQLKIPGGPPGCFHEAGILPVECLFANLPGTKAGRLGVGPTAPKMAECRWLEPVLVGQFEFVNWTEDAHLRHSRFMGLREDRKVKDVRREA